MNSFATHDSVTIPRHANGPIGSGHGGVSAGVFASAAGLSSAKVRFHASIPLATPLGIVPDPRGATITCNEETIATVQPLSASLRVGQFGRLRAGDVASAEHRFLDHHEGEHIAPTCFACGNQRTDSNGLNLRPGTVQDTGLSATTWRPQSLGDVPDWMIWAALDCPSGFPVLAKLDRDLAAVTGELSVEILHRVPGNGDYQLIGRRTGRDGRKFATEAALIDGFGRALAVATATWIVVPSARLRPQDELATAV